jgi:hypothetical protein
MNATGCNSYTSPSGNYTWSTNGSYYDTLTNAQGCDSVLSIALTINTIDTNVLQNGIVLTSWATGASYQWLDCGNGYATISGATNQTFIPAQDGNYAVEVSDGNCTDTSACYMVTGVGLNELTSRAVRIYPNPNTGAFNIVVPDFFEGISLSIINTTGQIVHLQPFQNKPNINLPAGYYYLVIKSRDHQIVKPLIIQ